MTGMASLSTWLRPARRHRFAYVVLLGAPAVLVAAATSWRWLGGIAAIVAGVLALATLVAVGWQQACRYDLRWLVRRLDASRDDVEDSAGLLLAEPAALNPLQRLQLARLERRLGGETGQGLVPAWPARRLAVVWAAGLACLLAVLLAPSRVEEPPLAPSREGIAVPPGVPRLTGQRLRITPPAYTGLPARAEGRLDVRAPQGSKLAWRLRFEPQPAAAHLVFHRGERLPLRRVGDEWVGEHRLERSMLYRVVPEGTPARPLPPLHRLDATPDAPPRLSILAPRQSVTLMSPGQRGWTLLFEAADDYGIGASARLRITVTEGEGENISFKERVMTLRGSGPARRRRFAIELDPVALGLARGNDLAAQLTIQDNRQPVPQVVRGPSVILRWPAELAAQGSGVEGLARKALPAYFRSQRQIIIDAEQLLREKRRLAAQAFLERSDRLGVDQRLLRLRYGQFLGEEASEPAPLPTNDEANNEAPAAEAPHDDHPASGEESPGFGNAGNVLESFGHTHDEAEAATLLDPETRATLKQALDQMWRSELHLRQGRPDEALPFAYKALGFIKQVQQAQRIYLARVGPQLPPVDEARRMTGKREGLERRPLPPVPATEVAAAPARAWQALDDLAGPSAALPLDALEHWLRANEARVSDPLALVAAIDAVRQEPGCASCRRKLRALLWTTMPRPPAHVSRRDGGDNIGHRYLDALRSRDAR